MEEVYNIIPDGVEDKFFYEYEIKEEIIKKIKNVFSSFGYRPVSTPSFEYYEMFSSIDSTTDRDEMFKFIDENGKILVLRPDMTVPIARIAASNYKNSNGVLKLSYVTNVFRRNSNTAYGRKEFTQGGIECFGSSTPDSDAEIIAAGIKCIMDCGIKGIRIDIGHAGFFKGLVREFDINKNEWMKIKELVEKKSFDGLRKLIENMDTSLNFKDVILNLPYFYGKPEEVLQNASNYVLNDEMNKALLNMESVYEILKVYGYGDLIFFDMGLINHINYYTGAVFKGYINNYGKEIISGGRYDKLTKRYGISIPATGCGLNIDEIMEVIDMGNNNMAAQCGTDYLVIYTEESRIEALRLVSSLRNEKYRVEADLCSGSPNIDERNFGRRDTKEIIFLNGGSLRVINMENELVYECSLKELMNHIHSHNSIQPIH